MEILDLVFRGGGDVQVKVICMVGQLWRDSPFAWCGAIVAGVTQGNKNPKPTKPHFFFIGFV
jgi:hypothetical protein